jgi:hypothetical protein
MLHYFTKRRIRFLFLSSWSVGLLYILHVLLSEALDWMVVKVSKEGKLRISGIGSSVGWQLDIPQGLVYS